MAEPLIDVAALAELVERGGPVTVLDVRYRMGGPPGLTEFDSGHVPGASYVDLDTELASPPGVRGRHPLPESAVFEAAMRRAGVSDTRPVVVYDDWSAHAAARCWWLLRHHGHTDVRVLDGGWAAWTAAGLPVATGSATGSDTAPEIGDFTARPASTRAVSAENVRDTAVLIDARAPERYRGEVEPIDPVAGHIPGAVNVPTARNLGPDGRFLSAAELQSIYAEVGATPGADVAVYCGSGVTAAHDVLALEVAGVAAALYPGSWSEWVADPGRPVATSARP